tara:strand:- start:147 stop:467 length:321 start_codon:yes stop_codon:yes gene_type:complete
MRWITNKRIEYLEKKVNELLNERERIERLFDNRNRINTQLNSIVRNQHVGEKYKFIHNGNLIDSICTTIDIYGDNGVQLIFNINKTEDDWGEQVKINLDNCKPFCN